MSKLAIIDIGSNSMRALIIRIYQNKSYEIIDELKGSVGLGKDMIENGNLNPKRIEVAVAVLRNFKRICDSNNVTEIIAVATEAVRKAANQKEFLTEVKDRVGIDIRVLTGEEEAHHDYLGVINSMDFHSALLMDIGGSSTELILVEDRKISNCISIPMGAITLMNKFLSLSGSNDKRVNELVEFLNNAFDSVEWLKEAKDMPLVGIGGSFRTLGKVYRNKSEYPLNKLHNYEMSSESIIEIYDLIKSIKLSEYKKIKGISKDRADIFLGAFTSIFTIIKYCKFKKVIISESGLRQGVLYRKLLHEYPYAIRNVLDFSLNNIIHKFGLNECHINQVWKFCKKISSDFSSIFDCTKENYNILKVSSYLYDCGTAIEFNNHEKYSFSIITGLKIYGLTHKEQIMAAFAISNFDENKIKNSKYFNSIIKIADIPLIQKMSIIVRIAKGLDRAADGNVIDIKTSIGDGSIIIKLISKQEPLLEVNTISEYKYDFEKVFGRKLIIE